MENHNVTGTAGRLERATGGEAFSDIQVNTTVPIFRGDSDSDGAESGEMNYNMAKRPSIEITAPHIDGGHTFLLTISETVISTTTETTTTSRGERAVCDEAAVFAAPLEPCADPKEATSSGDEAAKAIVPLSSSLPSKLLRLHARRSAQALLERVASESESQDVPAMPQGEVEELNFIRYEDATAQEDASRDDGVQADDDFAAGACAIPQVLPMIGVATAPLLPSASPREELIDCGVGSSIEGSEESEEDDELKPLAVDNHVRSHEEIAAAPGILSEANLEKFHKHHHTPPNGVGGPLASRPTMENIYLHPNFHLEMEDLAGEESDRSTAIIETSVESSPPPAVAPANSPVEQRRIHRSFLAMTKKSLDDPTHDSAHSVATTEDGEGGGDCASTINEIDNLDASLVPNEELASEIANAVEFYFSDESILKDAFLLKHVRRNKEGFVSLKLVSSFKRVRQLTKDWRVVGHAVRRKSQHIELNECGTKVRRIEALPNFDETMPSRTIVASDLPIEKLSMDKVNDIFAKCGEIALIRILKPGMNIPVDVRQFMNKYPEMMQKECALVEFVESSAAREARHLDGPFSVYEMVAPKKKTGKKATTGGAAGNAHAMPHAAAAAPMAHMVENYRYFNDATYERTRGGSFSGIVPHMDMDLRFKLKRNNSDFNPRVAHNAYVEMQHHQQQQSQQHYGRGGEREYERYQAPSQHHYAAHQHHPQGHQAAHHATAYNNSNSNNNYQSSHRGSFGSGSIEHDHALHQYQHQHYQPRGSLGGHSHESATVGSPSLSAFGTPNRGDMSFHAYSPRRYSNTSTISANNNNGNSNGSNNLLDSPTSGGPTKLFSAGKMPTSASAMTSSNGHSPTSTTTQPSTMAAGNGGSGALNSSSNSVRRISNCSDGYGPYSESSRRPSNCSESAAPPQRRDSNCSDSCPCSRRVSDFDVPPTSHSEIYRKTSQGSIGSGGGGGGGGGVVGERRYSNGSMQFERTFSNDSQDGHVTANSFQRRLSNSDFHGDRRQSLETQTSVPYDDPNVGGGGGGYMVFPRRCSNSFNNTAAGKLAAYDNAQYINGRRISTDSGYDRRYSFGSEYEGSPRSRTGSFINSYKGGGVDLDGQPRSRTGSFLDGSPRSRSGSFAQRNTENLVRTPIGPDGSKGFGSRARKFGQTVSPVN